MNRLGKLIGCFNRCRPTLHPFGNPRVCGEFVISQEQPSILRAGWMGTLFPNKLVIKMETRGNPAGEKPYSRPAITRRSVRPRGVTCYCQDADMCVLV